MLNLFACKQNARPIALTVLVFVSILGCRIAVHAQNDTFTPLGLKAGTPPGSYPSSDIDSVNLFNGKVNVRIPLVTRQGRGAASSEITFTWDSPMRWQVYKSADLNGNPVYGAGRAGNRPDGTTSYGSHSGEYSVYAQGVGTGAANYCSDGVYVWGEKTLTRLYWVEPDGTDHEMRDVLTGGQPLATGGCWSVGPNRGKVFVSTDGSGVTFISDAPIQDGIYVNMEYPSGFDFKGWLLLKDGRRIRISHESDHGTRDRNGNLLPFNVDPFSPFVLDGLNRKLTRGTGTATECGALVPGATACSYNAYKGFGGAERRIYYFSDENFRLSRVFLPNGRSYRLYYNNYDDLIRIDLPSGGSIEYEFEAGLSGNPGTPLNPSWPTGFYWDVNLNDAHFYRRVTERRVYREGHVLESRQTFSKPESSHLSTVGYVEKKNYDGNGTLLSTERHHFYGNAEHSFWVLPTQYSSWKDGLEWRTETYDGNGNLMRTVNTSWEQRAPVSWWPGSADEAPANDPRISQVTTILENGQQHTTSYTYDSTVPYNSLTDVIQRDYNLNILRHTKTTYLKTLNGVDYAGLNVQTAAALHMRDLPLQVSLFGWGGVEEARTTYEYDNYNSDANHALLIARSNISGLDASYTTGYTTRGNVTGTTRYLISSGVVTGSVTAYAQYDVAGNIVKTIDERGNASTFSFTDRFGAPDTEARTNSTPTELSTISKESWAYPSLITNALGHTTYTQADFYTGQAVNIEDGNGVVSSVTYADPLERATQAIAAANNATLKNQVSYSYDDVNRIETTTKDRNVYGDNLRKAEVIYDGLGRRIESRVYENSTDYISTRFNSFGLTSQESNPYRPLQGENLLWTTTVVDALGRIASVTTPDSAVVTKNYTGNSETVTDQTGKKRRSVSDSLGRVSEVYEDPNSLNYQTIYGYNARGELVSVNQGYLQQPPRAFVYDTLGRLVSASNPESGTITLKYDEVGNLVVRTDARGVSTHFAYDGLNRPVRRWYNSSNLTSATTHNSPALPSGVGTTNEVNYFYDSQTLPPGSPSFTRGPSVGALVAITYGSGSSAGDYFARDAIGREWLKIQQVGGVNYQMTISYNNVGEMQTLVYPSGRTVEYTYDHPGRLSSLAGNLGDGTGRIYSSSILYTPFGGVVKEQFGTTTPIYNKLRYNNRLQLAEILASTSYTGSTDLTWNRGKIINHFSDQCVGACTPTSSMTDNNGNLKKQEVYIPNNDQLPTTSYSMRWQQYNYDALNRLDWAREVIDGGTEQWKQAFIYDRWGNRKINTAVTYGTGINNKNFDKDDGTNRLYAPGDLSLADASRQMRYDAAGNQIKDTYSGYGSSLYDGDNRITAIQDNSAGWTSYTYSGDGQRVRRNINNQETWQIYGFSGELLAEYPASGATGSPQKEYGYRNGQLLVTASPGSDHSLQLNGSTSYVQVPNSSSLNITGAITVEAWFKVNAITGVYQDIITRESYGQAGTGGGYELCVTNIGKVRIDLYQGPTSYTPLVGSTTIAAGVWHHVAGVFDGGQMRIYLNGVLDGTLSTTNAPASGTSSLKIGRTSGGTFFNGLIDEARVSNAAVYTSNFTPQTHLTASSSTKGLWKFDGQSTADSSGNSNNGSLQGGAVFSSDVPTGPSTSYYSGSFNGSTSYVQVPNSNSLNITGAITVEAWFKVNAITGVYQDIITRESYGQAGTGGGYELCVTNIGKVRMDLYQGPTTYTPLVGSTTIAAGVWHHVAGVFDGSQMRIYLNGVLDGTLWTTNAPASGTSSLKIGRTSGGTFFNGLIDEARVSNAAVYTSNFTPQTHLTASSSTKGLWKFDGQSTADSSGNSNNGSLQGGATYSDDVPGGGGGGGASGSSGPQVLWFIADQIGSPRMVFDQTGSLANTKRHDYLPFGEELGSGIAGRSTAQGYKPDSTRQRFTGYEADVETGLHYARNRYQSSVQGRFNSADPLLASGRILLPQSWNRYSYVLNQPLVRIDPFGLQDKGQNAKDKDIKETQDYPEIEGEVLVTTIHVWGETGKSLTSAELAVMRYMSGTTSQATPTNTGGTGTSANDGVQDTNNALNALGNFASISQYRYLSDDTLRWKGKNGKWNSIHWGGNQHTGARSVYATRGAALRALSRTTFVLSTAVSAYQLVEAYKEGNTAAGVKAGVDIVMGFVGTFGGPIGAGVAVAYFATDYFIGWDNIGRAAVNLVSTPSNKSGP